MEWLPERGSQSSTVWNTCEGKWWKRKRRATRYVQSIIYHLFSFNCNKPHTQQEVYWQGLSKTQNTFGLVCRTFLDTSRLFLFCKRFPYSYWVNIYLKVFWTINAGSDKRKIFLCIQLNLISSVHFFKLPHLLEQVFLSIFIVKTHSETQKYKNVFLHESSKYNS